jgi:hypothetical protein
MFGGLAFFLRGNLLVGIMNDALIMRVGPTQIGPALRKRHVSSFAPTGRPMKGWGVVAPDGLESDAELSEWIEQSLAFVQTLPPKP